jgi:hypothetical protein
MEKGRSRGPSPKTKTVAPERIAAAQDFERLPRAVARALSMAELEFDEHGLLTFLIGSIDFRTQKYVNALAGLGGAVQWTRSSDYLRKTLRDLEEKEWITLETRPGPHAPYVIRLGPRVIEALTFGADAELSQTNLRRISDSEPPLQSETISDSLKFDPSANGHEETDLAQPNLRTGLSFQDGDADETKTKTPTEKLGVSEGSTTSVLGVTTVGGVGLS